MAASGSAPGHDPLLKVASWNVLCFSDPVAMGRLLAEKHIDVACLQEVMWGKPRPPGDDEPQVPNLRAVAEASGLVHCAAGVLPWGLGNAVLSRHPIEYAAWVDLDAADSLTQEHRTLVVVVVRVPASDAAGAPAPPRLAVVACIHVDHQAEDSRVLQFRQAAAALGHTCDGTGPAPAGSAGPVPHVLLGDFNSVNRADYPDSLWERMEEDRRGFRPAGVRLMPSLLRAPTAEGTGIADKWEGAYGYTDAAKASWRGLVRRARAGAAPKGELGEDSAEHVMRCARVVARARRLSEQPHAMEAATALLRDTMGDESALSELEPGHWDARTTTSATASGVRLLRRWWLCPRQEGALVGSPLTSTCRFATRIDFVLVHAGGGGAAASAAAGGVAATDTATVGAAPAALALEAAPALGPAAAPGLGAEARGMAAPAEPKAVPWSEGIAPVYQRDDQPPPTPAGAVAAALRRLRPCVLRVVPGSYHVTRSTLSDHDMLCVTLRVCEDPATAKS